MDHTAPMPQQLISVDVFAENEGRQLVNPLNQCLGYQLRRASVVMLADLTASVADLDLKVAEVSILLVIDANPDITQSDIGRMLSIQRANMVPLTALLTRRKLIRREGINGRSHALRLTKLGKDLALEGLRRISVHEQRFLKNFPAQDQEKLIAQLRLIWEKDAPRIDG